VTPERPHTGRLPDFLVIGAMRSGTTSLYRYLGAHPSIVMAPKELQYFTVHHDRGPSWYAAHFDGAPRSARLGEATADYLARGSAMRRIREELPGARLVASLRNPTDRAWSHYWLLRERGRENRSFQEAIFAELATLASNGPDADNVLYLAHGLYDHHLERAFGLFPRERIHVLIFEDLVADPGAVYTDLCGFIGVDDEFRPSNLGTPVNAYARFRSVRLRRLGRSLPSPVDRIIGRLNTRRDLPPPRMDDATRRMLVEFHAPHVTRLEELLGKTISQWR
jgi:hypothetical protein